MNKEKTSLYVEQNSLIIGKAEKNSMIVIGAGYVGLPTAALFANVGFNVTALDINPTIVDSVNCGESPINEPGLQDLISNSVQIGKLKAVLPLSAYFNQAAAIIISVQTPISKNKKPDLSFLINALENVGKNLKPQTLVVVCSTIPPGTMQKKVKPLLESLSRMKADHDFYLAYVPERIAPGKALNEFIESPRLVGGIGNKSTKIAANLFRTVCKNIIETDAITAEVAKVAENTFRDVNIAFANQLAIICEQNDADVLKVIKLANTHPRVNIHTSGPGVGGPCLTKDPYLLINETTDIESENIIKTARKINDYMPYHVIELTVKALKNLDKDVQNSKIAVLGTAYKGEVDDSRFSPSESVISGLLKLGAQVTVYDLYCAASFGAKKMNSVLDAVKEADCLVIMTEHKEFKDLDLLNIRKIMKNNPVIVDGKRIIDLSSAINAGFEYFGVGYKNSDQ